MKPLLQIRLIYLGIFFIATGILSGQAMGQSCNGRRIILHPDSNLGSYNNGRSDFLPGDTILLNDMMSNGTQGVFSEIWFQARGTASCPIVFMNDPALGHAVSIRGLSGQLALLHCQYVKVTGSGRPDIEYGISIDHSTAAYPHGGGFYGVNISGRSKCVQLERISIRNCTIGMHIKQDPGCIDSLNYISNRQPGDPWYPNFIIDSIIVNNCSVVGSANEGMYIGNTGPDNSPPSAGDLTYQHRWYICPGVNPPGDPNGDSTYPEPLRVGYVHLYNNSVDSSGRGGIQVVAADLHSAPVEINNNLVRHSGMLGMYGQGVGISVGPYQSPYIHDNTIISTTSEGIATFGGRTNQPLRIENNYIDSSGYQAYYLYGEQTYYPAENWTIIPNTNTYAFTSMYITSRQVKYDVPGDSIQFIIRNNKFGLNKSVIPDGNGNVHVFQLEDYRQLMQQNAGSFICGNTTLDGVTPAVRPGHDVQVSTLGTYPNPYRNPQLPPNFSMVCPGNFAPNVFAGLPDTVRYPASQASLNGVANDVDGTIASYAWTLVSGPAVTITNPSSEVTTITGLTALGNYVFRLTVTDDQGATASSDVTITVASLNQPPVANAGSAQTITLPTIAASLSGSGNDPDGTIASYVWLQVGGTPATIANPSAASTPITGLTTIGVRTFRLTVTDNLGATGIANVTVTVNSINVAPTANAGAPQTITLPASTVTLNGSGIDPDGSIASYSWTQISGTTASMTSPLSASTTVSGLTTTGVRVFRLTVTDNQGATDYADVTVTVLSGNMAPTANAGLPQIILLPTSTVTLTGSGNDADGSIVSYAWTQVGGITAAITSPSSASTTITGLTTVGVRIFRLTVTDDQGATGTADVVITVNLSNMAPSANAGPAQTITLPASTVTLTGSGIDLDGTIVEYRWLQISGTAATITSPASATTTITGLTTAGVRVFRLQVIDDQVASGVSDVMVTVNASQNQSPVANAGAPQTITWPTSAVTLIGTGSDPDGNIVSYAWTQISGTTATIGNPATASTNITGLTTAGVRVFRLTVTDNVGATDYSDVTITVTGGNIPPVSNAGASQTIAWPISAVTLIGSGTDPDGTIASYAWTQVSGTTATIGSPATASTNITGMTTAGVRVFRLTVTDNLGATGYSDVTITVIGGNIAPVANAGSPQTILLPNSSVTLNGNGTDQDGTIASYAWTQISGTGATIANPSSASTTVTGLTTVGIRVFRLTVTDNFGATGTATVTITVDPANQAPTANAGVPQTITWPTSAVTLTGSGSDPDGNIVSYAWTQVSGTAATIGSPATSATNITGMTTAGLRVFRLTVTDNQGATGFSDVTITVIGGNIAPVANAGSPQTIIWPLSAVTLIGSGSDPDGNIVSYAWTQISGTPATIGSPATPSTNVTGMTTPGVRVFRLTVTDNQGATGVSQVTITVTAALPGNMVPVANAGPTQTVLLPVTTATLNGSGTDPDGTIVGYLWTQLTGAPVTLINATSPSVTVNDLTSRGTCVFQLRVTDNLGAVATDTVSVIVDGRDVSFASVFPNPASNVINISIDAATFSALTKLKIINTQGSTVYEEQFQRTQPEMIRTVDVSTLAPGTYFILLNVDINTLKVLKFVKQ